jgi:Ca-activated chloride channel family protein
MISFQSPWLLLGLAVVPVAVGLYLRANRRRAGRVARLAAEGLVQTEATQSLRFRRHIPFGLFVVALTLLGIALGRPTARLSLPSREGTVILAIDVSNSMNATDLKPTRIAAAKAAARAFVERQPKTVKIGVVAFGGSAVTVLRPSSVKQDALDAIDRLSVSGGTSLGQGLYTSLSTIAGKPLVVDEAALSSDVGTVDIGYYGSSAIVVLSDGENTDRPDPLTLAKLASGAGVKIDTVGVGTPAGTVVQVDGFNVATALNDELLTNIASVTDGRYFPATDAASLAGVYKSIDLELTRKPERREVTVFFAAGAGLLLTVGAALSLAWFGRVV